MAREKLSLGLRKPPPTAERMLLTLESEWERGGSLREFVKSMIQTQFPNEEAETFFVFGALVQPGRNVVGINVVASPSGLWLFDCMQVGPPSMGCKWAALVRFDVRPYGKFATVGISFYDGGLDIAKRLQMGTKLAPHELSGGYFYCLLSPFLAGVRERLSARGVPSNAHSVPNMV